MGKPESSRFSWFGGWDFSTSLPVNIKNLGWPVVEPRKIPPGLRRASPVGGGIGFGHHFTAIYKQSKVSPIGLRDFDLVVVGGGSAGCVVAGHLSQRTKERICLLEAGHDYGPRINGQWPQELLDPRRKPETHDWGYLEERLGGLFVPESRARVMGGCSSHNQCGAVWGHPDDYDGWEELGNLGWGYSKIRPLIDELEDSAGSGRFRGHGGAVPTRPYGLEKLSNWQRLFLETALKRGFRKLDDLSNPEPLEGVMPFHANVKDSTRWNASFAFLDHVRGRDNLLIMDDTLAERLVVRNGRATDLVCVDGTSRNKFELHAERFVLSAGAYGSPTILMRSGIGPSEHLRDHDIPVQIDLSGVGKNLHDHPGISMVFQPTPKIREQLESELAERRHYQSQTLLRAKSSQAADGFDLNILPYQGLTEGGRWSFELLAFNMTPLSRGEVLLKGKDPQLPPRIDFRFLTDGKGHDLSVLRDGLRICRRLAETRPLSDAIEREFEPGPESRDDDLNNFLRANVTSFSHPVGTCRMGPRSDPYAVVGVNGLVRGTSNIFVGDASIMPVIPRAPINLTCMLIGLKVANGLLSPA